MPSVALKAHFDGVHIVLDEAFDLAPNSQLIVTVLPPSPDDAEERSAITELGAQSLARACGDDESAYDASDLKDRP